MSNVTAEREWDPKSKEGQLLRMMRSQRDQATAVIAKFAAELAHRDPDNVFQRADSAFRSNGSRTVAMQVIEALTRPDSAATVETLQRFVLDKLINDGFTVEHSSGVCSNLVKRFELAAWAKLAETMRWL